jgi:hypothetical protein
MTPAEMNLELVKLCYRHDKLPKDILDRATTLRKFVLSSASTADEKSVERNKRKKQAGTAKASA